MENKNNFNKVINPKRALSVEGVAHSFFYLIQNIQRYQEVVNRLNNLFLSPKNKEYLSSFRNEKEIQNNFVAPTEQHAIMSTGILSINIEKAEKMYNSLKQCFIKQYGEFWGQIDMNSIFLDYATRKLFIRNKIKEIIEKICKNGTKNKKIYFVNTGAGLDNTTVFVNELCKKQFNIEVQTIELDIPSMSIYKRQLMTKYNNIEYIGCDISKNGDVDKYIETLKNLKSRDNGKEIYFINLSEGLTPYIKYNDMKNFTSRILEVFDADKSYQILDCIVWEESNARLNVARKYADAFKSTVISQEDFIEKYSLGIQDRYDVYHPATEVKISREYKVIQLLKVLNQKQADNTDISNEKDIQQLNDFENTVRQYYQSHRNDNDIIDQIVIAEKIVTSEEFKAFKNDFKANAYFMDTFEEETHKKFEDTKLFEFLFDIANACQSTKYLWNTTLVPKTENEIKITTRKQTGTFIDSLTARKEQKNSSNKTLQ